MGSPEVDKVALIQLLVKTAICKYSNLQNREIGHIFRDNQFVFQLSCVYERNPNEP